MWRAYIVRKNSSKQLQKIRDRAMVATANATVEKSIGYKCAQSVDTLLTETPTVKSFMRNLTQIGNFTQMFYNRKGL